MRRILLSLTLLTCLAAVAVASAAGREPRAQTAQRTEVGRTSDGAQPSCGGRGCLVIARTTAFTTRIGRRQPFVVPMRGRIVAFTLKLGSPTGAQIRAANGRWGTPARVRLTILRPERRGGYSHVIGQSTAYNIPRYFGSTSQFALTETLPVRKGDIVALTIPTWAPVLAVHLPRTHAWRASRARDHCNDFDTQSALTTVGERVSFPCLYRTARPTYTATLISTP